MSINYVDIAILAIMVLAFIIGLVKGFWKTFSKALTLIVALVVGFVFAERFSAIVFKGSALSTINDFIFKMVAKNPLAGGTIVGNGAEAIVVTENIADSMIITDALKAMLVPSFLHQAVFSTVASGLTLGAVVSSAYTHLTVLFLSGTILFLGSLLVMRIIAAIILKAVAQGYVRFYDRFSGGLLRLVTGALFILIVFHLIHLMSGFSFMSKVITYIQEGKISGFIYELDIFNKIFYGNNLSRILDFFKNLIPAPGQTDTAAMSVISSFFIR